MQSWNSAEFVPGVPLARWERVAFNSLQFEIILFCKQRFELTRIFRVIVVNWVHLFAIASQISYSISSWRKYLRWSASVLCEYNVGPRQNFTCLDVTQICEGSGFLNFNFFVILGSFGRKVYYPLVTNRTKYNHFVF